MGNTRKRSRPELGNENLPAGFFDERDGSEEEEAVETPLDGFVRADEEDGGVKAVEKEQPKANGKEQIPSQAQPEPQESVNEDEWAAFQAFTTSVSSNPTTTTQSKSALDALNSST